VHSRIASRIIGLYCVYSRTDSREEAREWCKFDGLKQLIQLSIDLKPGLIDLPGVVVLYCIMDKTEI